MRETCVVGDCHRFRVGRGLCQNHYKLWQKGRPGIEALPLKPRGRSVCSFDGCDKPVNGLGLCSTHYQQRVEGRELRPVRKPRTSCSIEGCPNPHDARGLCSTHYAHAVGRGEIPATRAPLSPNKEGYVRIFQPGHPNSQKSGHIFEHIYVMSSILGRPLLPGENVHHVNGVKHDNRPENLELWLTKQCKGQRVEDLVEWATEILHRYRPDLLA